MQNQESLDCLQQHPKICTFATIVTKREYLPGALVVAAGLRKAGSKYPFTILATPGLDTTCRDVCARYGIGIRDIDPLLPPDGTKETSDVRFADTWTKLR